MQTRIIVEDLIDHPRCKHGPMLRFCQTDTNSNIRSKNCEKLNKSHFFYACAAYRDRKKCSVYHKPTVTNSLSKSDKETNKIQVQQQRFYEVRTQIQISKSYLTYFNFLILFMHLFI